MRFLSLAIPTSFLFSQLELVARTLHIEFSQHAKNQQDDNSCFFIFIMVVAGSDVGDFFFAERVQPSALVKRRSSPVYPAV